MRSFGRFEKVLSMFLVMAIGSIGMPVFASPAPALLSGKILKAGTGAPVQGAVVKLNHRTEGKVFTSGKADAQGSYSIPDLPAGTYDLAVESDAGVFVVNAPVSLASGEKRDASFSLRPVSGAADQPAAGGTAGAQPPPPAQAKPAETQKKKTPWYASPWFGTAVVVGSAVIIGAALNSSNNNEPATASPSSDWGFRRRPCPPPCRRVPQLVGGESRFFRVG
jgi:hypothetical protein